MFTYTRLMSLSATVLLLGLVACDEATAPTTTAVLTNAQADSVALVTTVDAAEVIEAGAISMATGLALSPPGGGPHAELRAGRDPVPAGQQRRGHGAGFGPVRVHGLHLHPGDDDAHAERGH